MNEALLSLAWQRLSFDLRDLRTLDGKDLAVVNPGRRNIRRGPDFLNAEVVIGGQSFKGAVEIHVRGSDWYAHKHHLDEYYNAVVLHAVAEPSLPPPVRADGVCIPEFLLRPRFDESFWAFHRRLCAGESPIACVFEGGGPAKVESVVVERWVEDLAEARFEQKTLECASWLREAEGDWEQAAWTVLAAAFGGPLNKEAFATVAGAVHRKYLARSGDCTRAVEALIFGAAGLLKSDDPHPYVRELNDLWLHLSRKFDVRPPRVVFSYSGMRPAAFPTVAWVRLAALWQKLLRDGRSPLNYLSEPRSFFDDCARLQFDDYWKRRIKFGPEATVGVGLPGRDALVSVAVNALFPLARLYAQENLKPQILESWRTFLSSLPAENNRVTRSYQNAGFPNRHPVHSQGLMHLQRAYCAAKRCLECEIGRSLLFVRPTASNVPGTSPPVNQDF
ncbi:MAG: DUF2851 family protein [Bacteroidia bacterium]|nr:DUF2851 family protein [Bacteroidia bacterium]MDW8332924.1 DUF2851 family protein [Bacteroidia bacterium]